MRCSWEAASKRSSASITTSMSAGSLGPSLGPHSHSSAAESRPPAVVVASSGPVAAQARRGRPARVNRARSRCIRRPAGPNRQAAATSTNRFTSWGWSMASCWAIEPPVEMPTMATGPAKVRSNICSDLGLVAATLVQEGLEAVEGMRVRAGNPVRPMLAQRMSSSAEILAKLGGACAAEYKYDGIRVQAHRTADGQLELFTRRLERVSGQFPDTVKLLQAGLGPREAILEGEVVAFDPASGELRPFQDVMFRRRKYGITEAVRDVPVSLFCFDLLYADGEDLTRLPYTQRRERLEQAVQTSPRLRLATAEKVG